MNKYIIYIDWPNLLENKNNIYYLGFGKNEEKSLTVIYKETLLEMSEALETVGKDKEAKGLILFSHKALEKTGCMWMQLSVVILKRKAIY